MGHVMSELIHDRLSETIRVIEAVRADKEIKASIEVIVDKCISSLQAGNKVMFAGNGGSAADAQHLAAEFVSRFAVDREGLAAVALTTDTSILTAIGNDYGFEYLFSRQIESIAKAGDVLIAISTSGGSGNILKAIDTAMDKGVFVVGFTGTKGMEMSSKCDVSIRIPSGNTANIQEAHITIGHIICGLVEASLSQG